MGAAKCFRAQCSSSSCTECRAGACATNRPSPAPLQGVLVQNAVQVNYTMENSPSRVMCIAGQNLYHCNQRDHVIVAGDFNSGFKSKTGKLLLGESYTAAELTSKDDPDADNGPLPAHMQRESQGNFSQPKHSRGLAKVRKGRRVEQLQGQPHRRGPQDRSFQVPFELAHAASTVDAMASAACTSNAHRRRKGVADIGTFYASDSDAVDHVFFSKHTMRVLQVRQPVDLAAKRLFGRFPNSQFGSDHFPVAAVFQLKPFSYPVWSRAFDATTRRLHSQHSMEMNYDSDDSSVSSASSASTEILCQRTAARCSQARLPAGAFGHAAASSQHQWMGAETSMPWQQLDSRAQTRISGWGSAPRMIRHVSAPVTVGASQEPEQSARSAKKKKPKRTKQRNSATAGNRVEVLRAQQQATVGGRGAAKDIFGGRPPLLRARSAGIPAASRAVPGSDTETVKHHRRLLHTRLFGSGGRPMGRPRSNSGLDLNLGFLLRARRNS
eukprot:INCI9897.3.p1 GENE.INCI9897.3~~INCI9897.3.p1  ORF type:complete len:496 (-),score=67.59 INCI9897.3:880-2367(-)